MESVSVIGIGKLAAQMAACLAGRGFCVKAVDLNSQKVDAVNRGVAPVHEPGLQELMQEAGTLLSATQNIGEAVQDTNATFIVVGTPSDESRGFSLQYVLPTCKGVGRALATKKSFHLVVLTVMSLAELVKSNHFGADAIGILGLTYKPNTDEVEESFGLLLTQELASANLNIMVFDPFANPSRTLGTQKSIRVATSAEDCIAQAAIVVLAAPWQQFRDLPASAWTCPAHFAPRIVIDCWRALDHLNGVDGVSYVRLEFGGAAERRVEVTSSAR